MTPFALDIATVYSGILPVIIGLILMTKKNVSLEEYSLFLFFLIGLYVGNKGFEMKLLHISNAELYKYYTAFEYAFLINLLCGYASMNRVWIIITGVMSAVCMYMFPDDIVLSRIEYGTLYFFSCLAISRIIGRSFGDYKTKNGYKISWCLIIYSLNVLFYSHTGFGALFFSTTNIIINIGLAWGLYDYSRNYIIHNAWGNSYNRGNSMVSPLGREIPQGRFGARSKKQNTGINNRETAPSY
jgi:hypothetical protein